MLTRKIYVSLILGLLFASSLFATEKIKLTASKTFVSGGPATESIADGILLSEGFEGTVAGWTILDYDGDSYSWGIFEADSSYDAAHAGLFGAGVVYNSAGNDDWLITPTLTVPENATVTFSFWARSHSSLFSESFNVKLSTGSTAIADFTTRLDSVVDVPDTWTAYSYSFPATAGQEINLALQCISVDELYLFADDFEVSYVAGAVTTNEVVIGTGTLLNKALPVEAYYNYSYTQSIYLSSEIGRAGTINEIRYHYNGADTWTDLITVTMGETSKTAFTDGDDWVPISDMIQVYSGELVATTVDGWVTLILDTPFTFSNTANLIIGVDDNSSYRTDASDFYCSSVPGIRSISHYSDGNNMTLGVLDYTGYAISEIANTTLVFASSSVALTADFSADVTSGAAPLTVQFSDASAGSPTAWSWDFNSDGTEDSNVQNPTYTYSTAGSYYVSLAVSDGTNSDGATKANYIVVSAPAVTADFSADVTSGEAPLTVNFTDASSGATSWSWDFDNDGVEDASIQNPSYTYTNPGTYTVSLLAADGSTDAIETKVDFITVNAPVGPSLGWTQLVSGTSNALEAIYFPSPLVGYAVGWNKTIIKTTDGGASWVSVMANVNYKNIYDVFFLSDDLGWACGGDGVVYKTEDGGLNWAELPLPVSYYAMFSVHFTDANNGFVAGNSGHRFVTTDGGTTWTDNPVGTYNIFDTHFVDANTVYQIGYEEIYKSTDGGANWTLNNSLATADYGRGIFFTDPLNGYGVGYNDTDPDEGFIVQTHDGGTNWDRTAMLGYDLEDIGFVSPSTGFFIGYVVFDKSYIYRTTDQGLNWVVDTVLGNWTDDQAFDVEITANNTAFIVGKGGLILRYGGATTGSVSADFYADVTSGEAPLTVNFTDASSGATSWSWDFDSDGVEDANVQNPNYTYTSAGTYTVTLTVSDGSSSDTVTKASYIIVSEPIVIPDSEWTWLNPTPQGKSFWDTQFIDANTGYAVGMDGLMMKTADGGASWNVIDLSETNDFYAVDFIDASTGYYAGESGMVYKTTDGGASSVKLSTPFYYTVYDLYFSDANIGFAAGSSGLLYKTEDGGTTWTAVTHPAPDEDLNKIVFVDGSTGFIVGGTYSSSAILKTTDGGTSWTSITSPVTNKLQEMTFVNTNVGYAGGRYGAMIKTTDGGTTWTEIATSVYKNIYGIEFSDENTGVIACEYDCYQTTDGGTTWTKTFNDDNFYAYSMAFATSSVGYVFGHGGHILKTADGGASWASHNSITRNSIISIEFYDGAHAVIVGSDGLALFSSDGGANWTNNGMETSSNFNDVSYVGINDIFVASNYGNIYHTADAGANWTTVTTSSDKTLYTLDSPADQVMYAGGYAGHVTKTLDGGSSWTSVNTPYDKNIYDISFQDALNGFAVGGYYGVSKIYKTSDGGTTWTEVDAPVEDACRKIIFLDNMTALISGDDGMLLRSTDGGNTWVQISIGSYVSLYDMAFVNTVEGYVVGDMGDVFHTSDAGLTWTELDPPSDTYFYTVEANGNDLFVGGMFGSLLNYAPEGGTDVLVANFMADITAGPAPLTVQFSDLSVGATTWSWDFNNDGVEDANIQNPSYTYADTGSYSVGLTITDGTNSNSLIKPDYIRAEGPANDWDAQAVVVYDADEADVIVRTGDIDNLGFGWPVGFDPFSGASTPAHSFPWTADPADAGGTDRIQIVSSYTGNTLFGSDGYTSSTSRPDNIPEPISLSYDLQGRVISSAIIQLFVDDFQASVWGASYTATLDGVDFPLLAEVINTLNQTGPVGKLITVPVSPELIPYLSDGVVELIIDDFTTGAGDGFAIDFVKLLINPISFSNTGSITGLVLDSETGDPVVNAEVWANNLTFSITNTSGEYVLNDIVAGLVYLQAKVPGYISDSTFIDLETGGTEVFDFSLIQEEVIPESFALLMPDRNSEVTTLTPWFVWNRYIDEAGARDFSYTLTLATGFQDVQTFPAQYNDTTFQVTEELLDNTTYYWSVMASDTSGGMIQNTGGYHSFTVNLSNDNPLPVDLITPDSVMVLTLQPEMYWTRGIDPDPQDVLSYEVSWWRDVGMVSSLVTDTNAIMIPSDLIDNSVYYWQVTSLDMNGGIAQSSDAIFWTDLVPEAPGTFALTSPANGVTGLSNRPVFTWDEALDPDPMDFAIYTLQIARDSSFTDIIREIMTDERVEYELTEDLAINSEYWWRVIATDTDVLSTESEIFKFTVGVVALEGIAEIPEEYALKQNYPNPFNPSTTIRFGISEDAAVSLVIYDLKGNTIKTIDSGMQTAGWYERTWNGRDDEGQPVATGLYLTRLTAGSYSSVIKMLYLK